MSYTLKSLKIFDAWSATENKKLKLKKAVATERPSIHYLTLLFLIRVAVGARAYPSVHRGERQEPAPDAGWVQAWSGVSIAGSALAPSGWV